MKWEKGRRGGNILDRRGMHRVDSLLARSPTFMREAGPAFVRPDQRYGESSVSEILRERPRRPSFNKGGVVGDGCAIRGKTKGKNC